MKLQTPSNVFDMTKCLMKLQEKYLESVRYEFNLSRIEIIILTFLYNNPSYDSARDIVEFRMLQRGNVSAAVDTLEKKGYLIRYTDSDDKRIVHLKLTEQTNDIVHAIEEHMNHSGYMIETAKKLAEIKEISLEKLIFQTKKNALSVFGIQKISKN